MYTMFRLGIAYIIAATWTVLASIYLVKNKKLLKLLLPVFDVAQSIPAIAIFPILVVFLISSIGGNYGLEIGSIILLLTGMQWYLLFNVIRALQAIPGEIIELSEVLNLKTVDKLKNILLPAIFPTFIIGSIQAVGGGWNASIISEYIPYKDQIFFVKGLGYLLDVSAAKGDFFGILLSVSVMIMVIIFLNKFLWGKSIKTCRLV